MKIPLLPTHSKVKIGWDFLILISVFVSALVIPYRFVSMQNQADPVYGLVTLIFFLDILVNLNSEVKRGLNVYTERRQIAHYYFARWFLLDLLAFLPWAYLSVWFCDEKACSYSYELLVLLRLLKLLKIPMIFRSLKEFIDVPPALVRLDIFLFWFVLIAHLMSLGWIAIGAGETGRSFGDQYLRALYWCITTIATIGYGDYTPNHESNAQIIYTIIVQIIGVGMFGYIIGNVATLVVNLDAARARFHSRVEEIRNYMRIKRIPPPLQHKVKDYYHYLWETHHGISDVEFLSLLPRSVRTEVALFLNKEVLEKVPLFKEAEEVFIREIIEQLEPMVFLPGDYIIRQGEYGDCMYFLNTGRVEVLIDGRKITVLEEGSHFGERALIKSEKRNASVRALTYCDVYKLSKHSFDQLRQKYPEFDKRVSEVSASREKSHLDKDA